MARIISVTFETESHAQPGHFAIPRQVASFLGIRDNDPVELAVTCEGFRIEVLTELRSGLEVYYRANDPSTAPLARIPAQAPLTVTVWRPGAEEVREKAREASRMSDSRMERGGQYQRLFTKLLGDFVAARPGVTRASLVRSDNWFSFSAGRTGFVFTWSITSDGRLNVELYIDVGDRDVNKGYFDALAARRDEIEKELGFPLEWERLDHRKGSRIKAARALPSGIPFEEDDELATWAVDAMVRMNDVFRPIVARLAPVPTASGRRQ